MTEPSEPYASRGALKLAAALDAFRVDPAGRVCADLGCSAGGFTDVLLRRGARRVHAVDTGYGVLAWRLRQDPRVAVHERTNVLRLKLDEPCGLVVVDVGWTRQERVVPVALSLLAPGGDIVSLLKPHYEAPQAWLARGVLPPARVDEVVARVVADLTKAAGVVLAGSLVSPLPGGKGGNVEVLLHLRAADPRGAAVAPGGGIP